MQLRTLPTNNIPNIDDSWERTEEALRVLNISLKALQESKPDEKKDPAKFSKWAQTYREMQKLFVQINYRRIAILQESIKK